MSTGDFVFELPKNRSSSIKVIGVGGGGSNAVNYMFQQGIEGVDFMVCNTDSQALNSSPVPNKIQLGQSITEGLGAGANPEIGEQAALESLDDVKKYLDTNTKMAFITAGMGGGTGTGAAPVIARLAKEMGILTVGIVTAPFNFEGRMRLEQAEKGLEVMQGSVDSLIIINNDKLRELYGNLGYKAGFAKADEILSTAAKGIAEVISKHYSTNIDLHDARTVLADSGTAIMGTGKAGGDNKAKDAVCMALDSPLLNNNKISGAQNVLLLIVSGETEVTMDEIGIINEHIQNEAGNNVNIIMGVGEDLELGDNIAVTVIATGFPADEQVINSLKEEKVVHTLEEEQAVVQRLSPEGGYFPTAKKTIAPIPTPKAEPQIKTKEPEAKLEEPQLIKEEPKEEVIKPEENTPTLFFLEEEPVEELETETVEPTAEITEESDDTEPQLVIKSEEQSVKTEIPIFEINSEETEAEEIISEVEEEAEFPQTIILSLDDDMEDENIELSTAGPAKHNFTDEGDTKTSFGSNYQKATAVEKEVAEEEHDPFDEPISKALSQAIDERRERLKQFNYKFKKVIRSSVDEIEKTPAFKRQGVELSDREDKAPSDYIVSDDGENGIKIKPNNFLHDNVD